MYESASRCSRHLGDTLTISIDGADSSECNLPATCEVTKATSGPGKIKVHVTGALVHGREPRAFIGHDNVQQGSNVTIQALTEVLVRVRSDEGKLPSKLWLQLDNTTKQNKARFVIAWLQVLVFSGVFNVAELHFLPVGHTHIDVDQFFSRVAMQLRVRNAPTLRFLGSVIRDAYTTAEGHRPVVKEWKTVANISEWMRQIGVLKVPNVTSYRSFRVDKNQHGSTRIRVRTAMAGGRDDEWRSPSVPMAGMPEVDFSCFGTYYYYCYTNTATHLIPPHVW